MLYKTYQEIYIHVHVSNLKIMKFIIQTKSISMRSQLICISNSCQGLTPLGGMRKNIPGHPIIATEKLINFFRRKARHANKGHNNTMNTKESVCRPTGRSYKVLRHIFY